MASPQTRNLDLDLKTLGDLLIKRLGLSSDQQDLLQAVLDNRPIDAAAFYQITRLQFSGGKNVAPTDLEGVDIALSAEASAGLQLGLYPAGANVVLADFTLPELHRAQRSAVVAADSVVCGLELAASVGAGAKVSGGLDHTLTLSVSGNLAAKLRFFKELPASGARDAIVATLEALSTPFNLLSRPPRAGEVMVAEYHGLLKLGADFDYGWSTTGTKKLGTGLDNLELTAETKAQAKLGASAAFDIENQVAVIVRGTGQDQWINVSFMKLDDNDAGLSLNLDVDASLRSTTGGGQDVGAFVDSLLGRTRIPDLMVELRKFDTRQEAQAIADHEIGSLVEHLTGAVEKILEGPAQQIDQWLQPVRDQAAHLVAAYQLFDADVRSFLENALEKVDILEDTVEAARQIADMGSVDDLLTLLGTSAQADKIRETLGFLSKTLLFDLSQISWLSDHFAELQALAKKIVDLDNRARADFTAAYTWFKKQLYLDQVVSKLETLDSTTARGILDEKILWLQAYLSQQISKPVERLVDHLDPVIDVLGKIVAGYDAALTSARVTLEKILNQEVGLRTSLAWRSVSSFQTLVSVDLDLAKSAGREAVKDLMSGDIRSVMRDRLEHADALRLQKSYFLDRLDRSLSLRVILNGRDDLRVSSALVSRKIEINPTANGEIWVQESSAQTTFQRTNRRAMINIGTLFQISLRELFLRHGSVLTGQGAGIEQYDINYTVHEAIKNPAGSADSGVAAATVVDQIHHVLGGIAFQVVSPAELASLDHKLLQIGELGPLGSPVFDVRVYLAPEALYDVFQAPTFDILEARIHNAWDRAVQTIFADEPAMLQFYALHKTDVGSIPQLGTQGAAILNRIQWNDAFNVINSRDSFAGIFHKLYKKVFQTLTIGTSMNLQLESRLAKIMKETLEDLALKMRWINSLEREHNERDFAMTVFANLVNLVDRSSSLVVTYVHPISQTTMTLRVDQNPPVLSS